MIKLIGSWCSILLGPPPQKRGNFKISDHCVDWNLPWWQSSPNDFIFDIKINMYNVFSWHSTTIKQNRWATFIFYDDFFRDNSPNIWLNSAEASRGSRGYLGAGNPHFEKIPPLRSCGRDFWTVVGRGTIWKVAQSRELLRNDILG